MWRRRRGRRFQLGHRHDDDAELPPLIVPGARRRRWHRRIGRVVGLLLIVGVAGGVAWIIDPALIGGPATRPDGTAAPPPTELARPSPDELARGTGGEGDRASAVTREPVADPERTEPVDGPETPGSKARATSPDPGATLPPPTDTGPGPTNAVPGPVDVEPEPAGPEPEPAGPTRPGADSSPLPGFEALADSLRTSIERYRQRHADFGRDRIGCDLLAAGYVRVSEAVIQLARVVASREGIPTRGGEDAFLALMQEAAEVDRQFGGSRCPRP